jgi:hypothetical protein
MLGVVTVVLHRDGRHHVTLANCTREDAERWAEAGFHVFLLAARSSELWAVNHVNSGKLFSNDSWTPAGAEESALKLLNNKGDV